MGGSGLAANRIRLGNANPEALGAMYGYMATKHAVVALSEMLALDLSGSRIGVSVLCPSHHENTGIFERTDEQREEALGAGRPQKFPDECAARVMRAIREGQFFIFTHPDTRAAVEHRCAQLLAGFDDSAAFRE